MSILKKTFIILLLIGGSTQAFAQNSPYADEDYSSENVFGIVKATNGGLISGVYFRSSRITSGNDLAHWAIEIVNVKHPKESRQTTFTGSSFILGKSNYLFSIRPTYGREKILFRKAPQQGVQISGLIAAGPSIGLQTPYFVDLGNTKVQYDPSTVNANAILGNSGPFRGLFSSEVVFGVNAKASLTFQTNSTKRRVFGVEVGVSFEAFTREIVIIPNVANKSTFTAAFLAIYFGKRN